MMINKNKITASGMSAENDEKHNHFSYFMFQWDPYNCWIGWRLLNSGFDFKYCNPIVDFQLNGTTICFIIASNSHKIAKI